MAQDLVGQHEHALHVGDGRGLGVELDQDVVALALVLDLVGEGPPAPALDPSGVAALGLQRGEGPVEDPVDRSLIGSGIEYDHGLVGPHQRLTSLWIGCTAPEPHGVGQVGTMTATTCERRGGHDSQSTLADAQW